MITIDEKALNFVNSSKSKNLCFAVCTKKTSINSDCGNCNTNVRTIKIKVLFETEVLDKELYDVYEYKNIKVFILKDLKINGDIIVYQKIKMPFMEPKFQVKGITV